MQEEKKLINVFRKVAKLSKTKEYAELTSKQRYREMYGLYPEEAKSHPIVFKMASEEGKFNVKAFSKYLRLYKNNIITPDKMPELGSSYLMYLEEEHLRFKKQRINRKELYKYKRECKEIMEKDMKSLKDIEKEERDSYKKKEEERLEKHRQELKDFFINLKNK